jgi:2-phosphosulfolactate phosphatase
VDGFVCMSEIDVVPLPTRLWPGRLIGQTVVVFDVLRATTTITAALSAGVAEVHLFAEIADARKAAAAQADRPILMGERDCLPPSGFDLGNSPRQFDQRHAGRVAYMVTTNGTRAILTARPAKRVLAGAIVNRRAVAQAAVAGGEPVTLMCAGTAGEVTSEDLLGAGAVIRAMLDLDPARSLLPDAQAALDLYDRTDDLAAALADSPGGRNLIRAGLHDDIVFAAGVDTLSDVARIDFDQTSAIARPLY